LMDNNAPAECTGGSFVIDADGHVRKATLEQKQQARKAREREGPKARGMPLRCSEKTVDPVGAPNAPG
jgi:hypothetical protein